MAPSSWAGLSICGTWPVAGSSRNWAPGMAAAVRQPEQFEQLKRGLAVVVSAEALFTLTDLCGLPPAAAIASAIETARSLTSAAVNAAAQ